MRLEAGGKVTYFVGRSRRTLRINGLDQGGHTRTAARRSVANSGRASESEWRARGILGGSRMAALT